MADSPHSLNILEWVGGLVLTAIGWAIHRYNAIHKKMDAIGEDVAVLKVQTQHNQDEFDEINDRLKHMEERWDQRRQSDGVKACIIKDYPDKTPTDSS